MSEINEPFPIPRVEICATAVENLPPESKFDIHCRPTKTLVEGVRVWEDCNDWITKWDIPKYEDRFEHRCAILGPPALSTFDPDYRMASSIALELEFSVERVERFGDPWAWTVTVNAYDQQEWASSISRSNTWWMHVRSDNISERQRVTYLGLRRTLRQPLLKGQDSYRLELHEKTEVDSNTVEPNIDDGHPIVKLYLFPDPFSTQVERETASFSIWEFLGNTAGVCSGLLFIYTMLMGSAALSPWGILQRALLKDRSYLRREGVPRDDLVEEGSAPMAKLPTTAEPLPRARRRWSLPRNVRRCGPSARVSHESPTESPLSAVATVSATSAERSIQESASANEMISSSKRSIFWRWVRRHRAEMPAPSSSSETSETLETPPTVSGSQADTSISVPAAAIDSSGTASPIIIPRTSSLAMPSVMPVISTLCDGLQNVCEELQRLRTRHDALERVLAGRYCKHLDMAMGMELREKKPSRGDEV